MPELSESELASLLAAQELVHSLKDSYEIASELAKAATVKEYQRGKQLYTKGDPGKDLYFILKGSIELKDENTSVGVQRAGKTVGEFPLLNPTLPYTVTAAALENSTVAVVSYEHFQAIAKSHPELWKNLSGLLAVRLQHTTERLLTQLRKATGQRNLAFAILGVIVGFLAVPFENWNYWLSLTGLGKGH